MNQKVIRSKITSVHLANQQTVISVNSFAIMANAALK